MKGDGGPAFPCDGAELCQAGMSLRVWFAGMALQGWLASFAPEQSDPDAKSVAAFAYKMADAMLKAGKEEVSS